MAKENKRYKNYKDILLDNWISPRLLWKGKVLVFTRHIIYELEKMNKDYEFVLDLKLPEKLEAKSYNVPVNIECQETNSSKKEPFHLIGVGKEFFEINSGFHN